MRKFLLFALTGLFCGEIAPAYAQEASAPTEEFREPSNYRASLSTREIIFVIGHDNVDQDIIDLLNQRVAQELAAGKKRITILTELRDSFKYTTHQELSSTDWAIILAGGAALLTTGFFLLKWAFSTKEKPSVKPPQQPAPNASSAKEKDNNDDEDDEWEDIPLDSPLRPTFADIDLDLDDSGPVKKRRGAPKIITSKHARKK